MQIRGNVKRMEKDKYKAALRKYDWRVAAANVAGCAGAYYEWPSDKGMENMQRRVDREMIAQYGKDGRLS
jgi:hypothetical protein